MKILVTTDGSERSLCVLPHAARLAEALGAELVLGRVLDPRTDAAGEMAERLDDAVARVAGRWQAELAALMEKHGVAGTVHVARRKWAEEFPAAIHRAADELGASTLAMSSRGAGALRHALLGSVTMGVIAQADLPVMALGECPPAPGNTGPYHIVVAFDGSAGARSLFRQMQPLFVPGRVRVTVAQVATLQAQETEAEARARALPAVESVRGLLPEGVDVTCEVLATPKASDVAAVLAQAALERRADAVAAATHGHSAARHLVAGSTALGLVKRGELPVFLVRSKPGA